MVRFKKLIFVVSILAVVGIASIAYGASDKRNPADIVSSLTGKSMDELYEEREAGKTFGEIADEAGKLDEFKSEVLKEKKAIIDEMVEKGELTQEQADSIYKAIEENQINRNRIGRQGPGRNNARRFGFGGRQARGMHRGFGLSCGFGRGMGF